MKGLPFCEPHLEYLQPDKYLDSEGKKLPPPCSGCAEISSRFRRANDIIKQAAVGIRLATLALYQLHPAPHKENPPQTTLIVGPDTGVT